MDVTNRKIALLDVVLLKRDSPGSEQGIVLSKGQQGTIVEDFGDDTFLVEFADKFGVTIDLQGFSADDLTLAWSPSSRTQIPTTEHLIAA